jgi:hypothetical protein
MYFEGAWPEPAAEAMSKSFAASNGCKGFLKEF